MYAEILHRHTVTEEDYSIGTKLPSFKCSRNPASITTTLLQLDKHVSDGISFSFTTVKFSIIYIQFNMTKIKHYMNNICKWDFAKALLGRLLND